MSGLFQNEEENDCRDDEQFVFPKGATVSYKYFIGFINEGLEVAKKPADGPRENIYLSPAFIDMIKSRCLPYCVLWSSIFGK